MSVVIDDDALATMGYVQLQIQQHNSDEGAHEAAFNAHNTDFDANNDKIATETEAEAQSNQNNSKFMTPLRVYQAIVAYFTKFLAAAVFTGIVKAVAPTANSNDTSVPTTSWVRSCITSMLKQIAEILEIQWKAEATGYLLFGPYLGNIKILWGRLSGNAILTVTLPVQCNNIRLVVGNDFNMDNNPAVLSFYNLQGNTFNAAGRRIADNSVEYYATYGYYLAVGA